MKKYVLTTTIINTETSEFKCELIPMIFESQTEAEQFIMYDETPYDIKTHENCTTYYIKDGELTHINKLWSKTIEY